MAGLTAEHVSVQLALVCTGLAPCHCRLLPVPVLPWFGALMGLPAETGWEKCLGVVSLAGGKWDGAALLWAGSSAAPAAASPYAVGLELCLQPGAGSLEETHWHGSGCWQSRVLR